MRVESGATVQAGVVLMLLAGVSAGLLVGLNRLGAPAVAENQARFEADRLRSVLSGIAFDNSPGNDRVVIVPRDAAHGVRHVYRVARLRQRVAFVLDLETPRAYSGALRMLAAVGADGAVVGVTVVAHKETPGLGDRIEPGRSDWLRQLDGRRTEMKNDWRLSRDGGNIDALTGATVTSRAALAGVKRGLEFLRVHRAAIEAAPAGSALETIDGG